MVAPYADLTIPAPGSRSARDVYSRALGRLPRDLLALPASLPRSPEGRADLAATQARVRALVADASAGLPALLSALRSPTLSSLVRGVRNELARPSPDRALADAVLIELCATLGFELDRAGAPGAIRLARLPRRVLSLGARAAIGLPDGAPLDAPYHLIAPGFFLATADNNPRASFGVEPGEPGNPVDLGAHPIAAWTSALAEALALIEEHLPELFAEIALYIQLFVPTGHHPETHRSASYRELIGAIYLSLHPARITLAEAIVHEFSHNKLHALFELDPVLENTSAKAHRSPLRADLRPLRGVLLAVHAYLPVALLHERLLERGHPLSRSHHFPERFAQIRRINQEGASVIFRQAHPTPVGEALIDEIRRWIEHFGP
jgi:hypothetical protein